MTQKIKKISNDILILCENPNTALQAIHLIMMAGGAGELSWQVVYNRVMADGDVQAAYYLIAFAQKTDDLPFDVLPLIHMVLDKGDEKLKSAMLDKLPDVAKEQLKQEGLI
ncbi:hypothetical protein LU293_01515 [Moraxella nasovis]|uniref:hypothetical protein n=1 Tax=Moraxella nasovis TaxID=2904121 RepID=UPI001F6112CB|nr:hypothetical protein [Moraxella nasovis]UNU73619.1 hypothetical protein LU293_01515 [Moraxella nasovis]